MKERFVCVSYEDGLKLTRKISDSVDIEDLMMPTSAASLDLIEIDEDTKKKKITRLLTNSEFALKGFKYKYKYYISYSFYNGSTYVRGTDNYLLNGRFLPKNCKCITLYTKNEFRNEIESTIRSDSQNEEKDQIVKELSHIIKTHKDSKEICTKLRKGLTRILEINKTIYDNIFRRRIYFGERYELEDVVEDFGIFEYMMLSQEGADGAFLCTDDESDNFKLLAYNEWENAIEGEIDDHRRIILAPEYEYVVGEEFKEEPPEEVEDDYYDQNNAIELLLVQISQKLQELGGFSDPNGE